MSRQSPLGGELMRLTRAELCGLAARIAAELPAFPEGSPQRTAAYTNLRNIRFVLPGCWRLSNQVSSNRSLRFRETEISEQRSRALNNFEGLSTVLQRPTLVNKPGQFAAIRRIRGNLY